MQAINSPLNANKSNLVYCLFRRRFSVTWIDRLRNQICYNEEDENEHKTSHCNLLDGIAAFEENQLDTLCRLALPCQ